MNMLNEQRPKVVDFQDSTAASFSSGSYSSAIEDNLSFMMRNNVLIVDAVQTQPTQPIEYAVITKVDRDRIKRVYPKPGLAKLPAVGEEMDIV